MKYYCPDCAKTFVIDQASPEKQLTCPECGKVFDKPEEIGPGIVLGDFLVEKLISRGGMGEVYIARQLSLDREVALKVLQKKYTGDQEYVDSLFHEARAAAKINHPNIVQAYMVGEDGGVFYFAMEYIRGETFKKILREKGVLDFVTAAKVIRDVASALDVAWREQKLVHQDIKPDNIMMDANGFTKLADLGLAKTAGMDNSDDDSDEVLGTPQYISPEQLTGVPTDVRSDLYSLGATFYHFVTGHFAYEADSAEDITKMHVAGNLTPPQKINPALPDTLNRIIVKMMARNIEERYQDPAVLVKELDRFLRDAEKRDAAPKISLSRKGSKAAPLKIQVPAGETENSSAPKLALPKAAIPKPAVPKPVMPKPIVPKTAVTPALPTPAADKGNAPAEAQDPAEEIKEQSAVSNDSKDEKPPKEKMDPAKRRRLIRLLSCWGGGTLLVLLLAALITGAVLERCGKLPSALTPPFRAINQSVARMLDAVRNKALTMAKTENPADPSEKKPAPIVTRPEYLEMLDRLIAEYNSSPGKAAEFIGKVDKIWPQGIAFQTPEERGKLEHLASVFSAPDENIRCREAREKMIRRHSDRLDAIDAKVREEAEKRRQMEAELAKSRQENAERMQKMAEQRAAEEKERQKIIQEESRKIDALAEEVAQAAINAALSDQVADLQKAVERAKSFQLPSAAIGDGIRRKAENLQKFCKAALVSSASAREYRQRLDKIDENSNVRVMFARNSAVVVSIKNGVVRYRLSGDRKLYILDLQRENPRTRTSLYKSLQRRKFDHPAFYLALFSGKMDPVAERDIPDGFWKEHWSLLKKYIH